MPSHPSRSQQLLLLLTTIALILSRVNALDQTYCSSQNTGSDNLQDTYTFQSLGHCHDECASDYAFAVVQGKQCWCSNYAPSDQQDAGDCDSSCPGYDIENCGNTDEGLYGYVKLDLAASGTQGSSSTAASTSSKAQTTTSSSTSSSKESTTAKATTSAAATTSSSSSSEEDSTSSSTKTGTPTTQVTVVTVGGSVVTQTVTSIPSSGDSSSSGRSSISGGQIAGAVVGGLAGIALIAGAVIWFLLHMRRKHEQQARDAETGSANGGVTPQRNVSTLSRTGLLRSTEKDYTATLPPINTARHSSDPSETMTPLSERRNSRPLFHDQRLNPQPFITSLDNGSHSSIISIEDNRDYTRTLNVRNPDPPERKSRDSW